MLSRQEQDHFCMTKAQPIDLSHCFPLCHRASRHKHLHMATTLLFVSIPNLLPHASSWETHKCTYHPQQDLCEFLLLSCLTFMLHSLALFPKSHLRLTCKQSKRPSSTVTSSSELKTYSVVSGVRIDSTSRVLRNFKPQAFQSSIAFRFASASCEGESQPASIASRCASQKKQSEWPEPCPAQCGSAIHPATAHGQWDFRTAESSGDQSVSLKSALHHPLSRFPC